MITEEEIDLPIFELGSAITAMGPMIDEEGRLPHEAIKNWTRRGFLNPAYGKRGKKRVRLYSLGDLVQIRMMALLNLYHTSLPTAAVIGDKAVVRLGILAQAGTLPDEKNHWIVVFEDTGVDPFEDGDEIVGFAAGHPEPLLDFVRLNPTKIEVFALDKCLLEFLHDIYIGEGLRAKFFARAADQDLKVRRAQPRKRQALSELLRRRRLGRL